MKNPRSDSSNTQKQKSSESKSDKSNPAADSKSESRGNDYGRDTRPGNPEDLKHQQIDESGAPLD